MATVEDHQRAYQRALEEEEEEELELELLSLTERSQLLKRSITSLTRTRQQLNTSLEQILKERRFKEQEWDRKEEEAFQQRKEDQNQRRTHAGSAASASSIRTLHQLNEDTRSVSYEVDSTIESLARTAQQVEELMLNGRIRTEDEKKVNQHQRREDEDRKQNYATTTAAITNAGGVAFDPSKPIDSSSDLPSMSVDHLSAFDTDNDTNNFRTVGTSKTTIDSTMVGGKLPKGTSSSSSSSSTIQSHSPWLVHHSDLLQAYLSEDDAWAKSLNELFKVLFGNGSTSVHPSDGGGVGDVNDIANVQSRMEIESVVRNTPHIQRLRSVNGTSGGGGTMTPARGKFVQKQNVSQTQPSSIPENDGYRTPPQQQSTTHRNGDGNDNGVNVDSTSSSSLPHGVAPSSTLTPELHHQYSSELTRLYESFPTSQDYWLCHNLLFLSIKSKIQEQHSHMVKEEVYKRMTRQELNETLAEVGLQIGTLTKKLSVMLGPPSATETSNDGLPSASSSSSSFSDLWSRLRSLQLLEVLRADLSYAHQRQTSYLEAQDTLLKNLLQQRSRHETMLGGWRQQLMRLNESSNLLRGVVEDLKDEASKLERRKDAYQHACEIHEGTLRIHSTTRLAIDSRAEYMMRMSRLVESGKKNILQVLKDTMVNEKEEDGGNNTIENDNDTNNTPHPLDELLKQIDMKDVSSLPSSSSSSSSSSNFNDDSNPSSSSSSSSSSPPSFDQLLLDSTFHSIFPQRLEQHLKERVLKQQYLQVQQLSKTSSEVRRNVFEDRCDLIRTKNNTVVDGGDVDKNNPNLLRLTDNTFTRLTSSTLGSVSNLTDTLNGLTQLFEYQRRMIDTNGDEIQSTPSTATSSSTSFPHATRGDIATRSVWTEFIQAPDVLEERVQQLKRQLQALDTR